MYYSQAYNTHSKSKPLVYSLNIMEVVRFNYQYYGVTHTIEKNKCK